MEAYPVMREEILQAVRSSRVIAIVRGVRQADVLPLAEALFEGGIRLMEVTYAHTAQDSYDETDASIAALRKAFAGRVFVGAGTVISQETLDRAARAGAEFIVSPDTNPALIRDTREKGLVSIPGALTPTEIVRAWDLGADLVKLFPADAMGLKYIQSLQMPLGHIPLLAASGMRPEVIPDYLRAGVSVVAVSSSILQKALLAREDYDGIRGAAQAHIDAVKSVRL